MIFLFAGSAFIPEENIKQDLKVSIMGITESDLFIRIIATTALVFVLLLMVLLIVWVIKGDSPEQKAAALTVLNDFTTTGSQLLFHDGKFLESAMSKAGIDEHVLVDGLKKNGVRDMTKVEAIVLDSRGVIVALLNEDEHQLP